MTSRFERPRFKRIWRPLLETFSLMGQATMATTVRDLLVILEQAEGHAMLVAGSISELRGRLEREMDDLARRRAAATTPRIRAAQGTPPLCGCMGACAHRLA